MVYQEGASSTSEAPFTNLEFYSRAVAALLYRANHSSDAHYLYGTVDLISEDGTRQPGTYRLSDYYAYCSGSFVYRHAEPYGGDQEEQRRLLELYDTAMNLQLYKDDQLVYPYYLMFWPYGLRVGSTMHETIYLADGWEPPATLPEAWPLEQPIILHVDDREGHTVIPEAGREAQLRELYQALSE